MKRVLLIAHAYPPQNLVGALRPFRFARHLPSFGYAAEVVTAAEQPPDAPQNVHYAPVRFPGAARWIDLALSYFDSNPSWLPAALDAAERVLRDTPVSAVVSTCPPTNVHVAALILKRRHGLPWIADFRDPLRGNFRHTRWQTVASDMIFEPLIFRHADVLVATTDATAQYWRTRHASRKDDIHVICNGFDPDVALTALPLPARAQRTILYAGMLYYGPNAILVLRSLERLIAGGRLGAGSIRLCMIGNCGDPGFLTDATVRRCYASGILEYTPGRRPLAEARARMAQSEYLLLLDPHRKGGNLQLPAKVFEYIEIGRPILAVAGSGSPSAAVLAASGIPHVRVDPEDSDAAVDGKLSDFLRLPTEPVAASAAYRESFGARQQTGRLAELLDGLIGARKTAAAASGRPDAGGKEPV